MNLPEGKLLKLGGEDGLPPLLEGALEDGRVESTPGPRVEAFRDGDVAEQRD